MKAHLLADQLRRQEHGFNSQAQAEDCQHKDHFHNTVELENGYRHGGYHPHQHSKIRNKRYQARHDTEQQAEIQSDNGQADAVKDRQKQTDRTLSSDKSGNRDIDIAHDSTNCRCRGPGQPAVYFGDNFIPVAQKVETDDRCYQDQRDRIEQSQATSPAI